MADLPKYFYFRVHIKRKGTAVEIEDASDVDVVEVIRCKDCKHYDGRPCSVVNYYNSEDDFCSRGERKDGDGNG